MADAETPPPTDPKDEGGNLESTDDTNALEQSDSVIDATSDKTLSGAAAPTPQKKKGLKAKLQKFNIYLLIFILILVAALGILAVAYFQSKKASTNSVLKTQALTQDALKQVASGDATVGSSGVVLNVQSSAVFAGKVLIRDGLEVAGNLQIGGTVSLNNISVSGTTQLGQLQVNKDLSVAGNSSIQGAETIAKSLQVNGTGTFNGSLSAPQITTSNLQLNSDLILTHHIIAGGPNASSGRGPALGAGGSSSSSGSDTTGTVSINVGSGATAGCFVNINFAAKFNSVPHVIITPIGQDAGTIDYYVTRTVSGFSICDATAAPTGASFAFDYFVVD